MTLVEILTVVTVSAVVLAGFSVFYLNQQSRFVQHRTEVAASLELRAALDQMVRDLRNAGLDVTSLATSAGITAATATTVTFTLDVDGDGDTTDLGETRGFRIQSGELQTYVDGSIEPYETIVTGLASPPSGFTFYNANGATTTDPAAVRRIEIVLAVDRTVPGGGTARRTETASAWVRN